MAAEDKNYFRTPNIVVYIAVVFGMWLTSMAYLAPESIPCCYLGYLGHFAKHAAKTQPHLIAMIFYGAWIVHTAEAIYAYYLCGVKNIGGSAVWKWVGQTFVLGVFSLRHLKAYKPKSK